ncbi:arginine-fifty homeobox [Cavia porcellus]|uniref:arginine-fifty homeobox n=1 Tax=Cavia porcellus TaxID=10141 RepID=UPI002FE1DD56
MTSVVPSYNGVESSKDTSVSKPNLGSSAMRTPLLDWNSQTPASVYARRKQQGRTSFTRQQQKELEALFSQTMFPAKNVREELAGRLNLEEKTVKIWFRNRRFKLRKQQKQEEQSLQQSKQTPPPVNSVPSSLRASAKAHYLTSLASDFDGSLSRRHTNPCDSSEDESPTTDFQMRDFQLDKLEASVRAVCSDAFDISQIIDLYSFPDECEDSDCFGCLYQYLSPTTSQPEENDVSLCSLYGPVICPPPGQTCIPSVRSQPCAAWGPQ